MVRVIKTAEIPERRIDMAIAILQNAGAGKPGQHQEVNITENGMMILAPDPGYSLDYASLNVDVKPGEQQEIPEINENGEQTVDIDFGTMTVGVKINANVPSAKGNTELIDGSITSYEIPEGTEKIRDCCFYGCNEMTYVKIPESITEIGREAFEGCLAMKKYDLTRCTAVPKIKDDSIRTDGDTQILVPTALYHEFCDHKNWKAHKAHFEKNAVDNFSSGNFDYYLSAETISDVFEDGDLNSDYNYFRVSSKTGAREIFAGVDFENITFGFLLAPKARKYLVLKYRSKLAEEDKSLMTDDIDVWIATEGDHFSGAGAGTRFSVRVQRDGRWRTIVLAVQDILKKLYGENAQYQSGDKLKRFRLDVFNPSGDGGFVTAKSYFDIAYIGLCDDIDNARKADTDYSYSMTGFDSEDLSSLLCGQVEYTESGMPYVNINCTLDTSSEDEKFIYLFQNEAVMPNVGRYAAVLYTGLSGEQGSGLVQVWISSDSDRVKGGNPQQQVIYDDAVPGRDGWRYGVADLSSGEYTDGVCRCIRFDYIDGFDKWAPSVYDLNLKIAFLNFFDSADEAAAYCEAYMRKYGLLEET